MDWMTSVSSPRRRRMYRVRLERRRREAAQLVQAELVRPLMRSAHRHLKESRERVLGAFPLPDVTLLKRRARRLEFVLRNRKRTA